MSAYSSTIDIAKSHRRAAMRRALRDVRSRCRPRRADSAITHGGASRLIATSARWSAAAKLRRESEVLLLA